MAFRKIKAGLVNGNVDQFVGEPGIIFYDITDGSLRISDGSTPGGSVIGAGGGGYTLPTASTTTKGGVKVDGTTITISNQIISATQPDLSSYATQSYVTTRGYLTSYTETDPVFLAHAAHNVTSTKITNWDTAYGWGNHASAGYLTSVGTISSLINGSDTLSLDGANKVNLPGGTAYIFSAANTVSLLSDSSGDNSFELINNVGATLYTDSSFEIRTNKGAIDRIFTFTQGGGIQFPDATTQTTAYTTNAARALFSASNASASGSGGSLAYSNGVFTFTPALNITGNAATVTNGVYTTDTGTVTNTMLAGSIANSKLANSSITVNGTSISLGGSATITAVAAAGTLTGTTLASGVTASSLTSVGTLTGLTSSGVVNITNTTATTLTGNGALVVNGGIGIGGGITMGGSINAAGSVNAVNFVGTGSVNANGGTVDSTAVTGNLYATPVTVNFAAAATAVNIGATTGTTTIRNPVVLFSNAETIRSTPSTLSLFNVNATTINFAGDATTLNIGAATGTTTINNALSVGSSVTANAAAAFIAGSNAISNVSLQMPSESALRNLTNGATNMYFDVSIGGSTNGSFQFRSSSSYTNVLTMSPTAVSFNTGAAVTARTPAMARTAFNAAIDTEITVDNMRFRISNQGGVFPQVIGNGSSRNLAWTAVGAISGTAVNQVGSTGTIVASNAWTTLYNTHGMDASGDTVTVTLQDKGLGAIYRITFMRSDAGGTGYNIIGERLL